MEVMDCNLLTSFFADECMVIKDILSQYSLASGQLVKYDKFAICFSGGVSEQRRIEMTEILSVPQVDCHDCYLGHQAMLVDQRIPPLLMLRRGYGTS